ncbi:MAG: hypothetical protein JSS51_05640 [Planctomycetes bacterium]|nr:hypothetical protein [Planctomycetota bacterium]
MRTAIVLLTVVIPCANARGQVVAQSDFSSGLDGWTPEGRTCALTNPGGYLLVQDIDNNWSRPIAPAKFNGNWNAVGRVSFDVRPDASKAMQWPVGLRVKGANAAVSEFEFTINASPIGVWTSLSVTIGAGPGRWNIPSDLRAAVTEFSIRIDVNDRSLDGGTLEFSGLDTITLWAACPADLNGDGFVDDSDFVLFLSSYNILDCADPGMPAGCPADLNQDGFVDDADFVLFVAAYNELLCP